MEQLQKGSMQWHALFPVTWSTYFGHALGTPLLTAVAYVALYPSLSAIVIEHYRKKQVAIANTVREIEGARLLTADESSQRTRLHETERLAWQERESTLLSQLRATREALSAAEKQANVVGRVVSNQSAGLTPAPATSITDSDGPGRVDAFFSANPLENLRTSIAKNLSKYTDPVSLDVLASNLNTNPLVVKSELQAMFEDGLVDNDEARRWWLTSDGEEFALELLRKPAPVSN